VNVTLVGDIAGPMRPISNCADRVTACSVCLPSGTLKSIRKKLRGLPKWRDCQAVEVDLVIGLVIEEALAVSVYSLATDVPAWADFWRDGQATKHSQSGKARGQIKALLPALQVVTALVGSASSRAVAHMVKVGRAVLPSSQRGCLQINMTHIYDDEIPGDEARACFDAVWRTWNDKTAASN